MSTVPAARPDPDPRDVKRWRRYLADEQAEAAVYRDLASRRSGEEREILLALADAEGRHEAHWRALLGDHVGKPLRGDIRTRILGFLARRFGSVFVLALAQRAETRSPYPNDATRPHRWARTRRSTKKWCGPWPLGSEQTFGDVSCRRLRSQRRPGQQSRSRARHQR